MNGLFLAAAFAALLTLESKDQPERPSFFQDRLRALTLGGLEIFFQSLLFLVLFWAAARSFKIGLRPEDSALLLLPGAYGFHLFRKKEGSFFLAVFAVAFYSLKAGELEIFKTIYACALVVAEFTLLRFLITGIQRRLLFSPLPRPFSGLPIFLVSVALLAMAVSWIPIP